MRNVPEQEGEEMRWTKELFTEVIVGMAMKVES